MKFTLFNKTITVAPTRKEITKMSIFLVLYIAFLIWVKSWLGVIIIPLIIDNYTTHLIPWKWWKTLQNNTLRKAMSWIDAIIFALVAVYFVHLYVFQNYVIPTSSLEKTLLVGDYLFVSKVNYGPRKPQTPLSMPLTQHTLPLFGCKSYIDAIQWDYERITGIESVDRDDIVVFNYPAGDVATTNPDIIDFHALCYMEGRYTVNRDRHGVDTLSAEAAHAMYKKYYDDGYAYINSKPAEYGNIVHRPVDRRDNYVKRCIGLPGETLEIKDRTIFIDGKELPLPKNAQFNYHVTFGRSVTEEKLNNMGISMEDIQNWKSNGILPLTQENYNRLKADKRMCRSIELVDYSSSDIPNQMYPLNSNTGWTVDNYGPVWIPKKGDSIKLTLDNIAIYERPIVAYEGNSLEIKDGKIFINGKESNSYTFKMDYYWMMGDNRHNSADSRMWGFVPEDHIVGKAMLVWLSLDKDHGWFDGKIRWNRMFKGVSNFD